MTFLDTGNPQFFNRYSYTFNDPINLIDPNGESPAKVVRFGVKVVKHKGDVKKAGRETFMEISESIGELADGDVSIDDVFAVIDLLSPVSTDEIGDAGKAVKKGLKAKDRRAQQRKASQLKKGGDKQERGTPRGNKRQNKAFRDATKGLSKDQKEQVHREISKEGKGFKEIKEIADDFRKD